MHVKCFLVQYVHCTLYSLIKNLRICYSHNKVIKGGAKYEQYKNYRPILDHVWVQTLKISRLKLKALKAPRWSNHLIWSFI